MRRSKKDRQTSLLSTIDENPFITDEELSKQLGVSIQTIRLDRLELSIPELRERIKNVAEKNISNVKALNVDEVIGEIIDLQLEQSAISMFEIQNEHVFSRNKIARGHHLFAQANSLAVAIVDEQTVLTAKANVVFHSSVYFGQRVIAKANVVSHNKEKGRTFVKVESFVGTEKVFSGEFEMYRAKTDN